MTRKGVAAVGVASMVGVVLSEELPGMLRRRPVLSGGDSVKKREIFKTWEKTYVERAARHFIHSLAES